MPSLLVISSAPAALLDGKPFLDRKFVEGMRFYTDLWDGPVNCLLRVRSGSFPFGRVYDPEELPFGIRFLPSDRIPGAPEVSGQDVVLCSGDNHDYLHLAALCRRSGQKLVFIIEYVPETRRQILFLDRSRSLPKKIRSLIWMLGQEIRRRRAFGLADGLQANGYPAFAAYEAINPNAMMYLDNRIGSDLLATGDEMAARRRRIGEGAPLRLVHSGRLERMKGSQDLIPIAARLAARGIDFELDIFGSGSLEAGLRRDIAAQGLSGRVRLNGVVDFETELVPFARQQADLYLSCHRQSDPSCTYLESMGCGLAVVGYANRMWAALCRASEAGWAVPLGRVEALADALAEAASDRPRLAACCDAARAFAGAHAFEHEFERRIEHLRRLA
ncbi:glycosyltransferase [Rhodovulum sulfidophilum]|uniref:glycosyltransferase n=1 Tax=Rhodovulum sulfidophilum TaxID=35806 RepID=UPI0019207135|nr:glycosyltransferase [Rhodovulum sulfidophilum]MBL3566214.1 glycosyltransferase [Rhodovulum sulfidophilum]